MLSAFLSTPNTPPSSLIRARVLDINVLNEEYTTYTEGDYKVIKIGDPYKTIIGEKEYNITYRYDLGKDKRKNMMNYTLI